VSVAEESRVDLREIAVDVEEREESEFVTYGFGAEAKFLKDGSDIRGAFQGNRLITMQLQMIRIYKTMK